MSTAKTLAKLNAFKKNPEVFKSLSNEELADLVILVLSQVRIIEDAIAKGRLDGKTPVKDGDYMGKETALKLITKGVNDALSRVDSALSNKSAEVDAQVQASIERLRDGNDGIVTEAEIQRAAEVAFSMLELPDFDTLVTTHITSNGEAIRDALELLSGDARYKVEIADVQGLADALNQLSLIRSSQGGTIGKNQVYGFIRQAIEDGTITASGLPDGGTTGQVLAKASNADGDAEWVTASGLGDMLVSVYDPAGGAEQVAFASELHDAVTVTDSDEIDFTLTGQNITATIKTGSIDESKLDTSVNASLDLADTSVQQGAVTSSGLTMSTARLLGRSTASTGAIEEITIGSGLNLSGGTLTSTGGFNLTASEIVITDASKNLVSASVATYPSLTELTYLKGVTSSIQTQLNAKGAGTVTSVAASVPTGLTISGSPVTTSGTLAIGLDTGYVIPLQTTLDSYVTLTGTQTVSGKRIQPRTASSTSNANLTPDLATANVYYRTTQTATLAINAPTGTPVIGEVIVMYITAAGAQTINWNATYIPYGSALPILTVAGKTLMVSAQYNGTNWQTLTAVMV